MKPTPSRVVSRGFIAAFLLLPAAAVSAGTPEAQASEARSSEAQASETQKPESNLSGNADQKAKASVRDVSEFLGPIREKHDLAGLAAVVIAPETCSSEARASETQAPEPKLRGDADPKTKASVRDVSEILRPIREKHDLPGLAAVVISGGHVVASGADGVRRRGSEAGITADDRFHLGSCTKSMTATLVATLVEEEKLSWSTTIGEVFKNLGEGLRPEWNAVTLGQLLTHRAGAPAKLDADGLWSRLFKREGAPRAQRMELVRGVLAREPESEPGTKYLYSNAGFAIAGAMAEKVANEAWEDLMRERIFEPLEMKSAGFGAPGTKGKLDEPLGHTRDGTPVELGPNDDNPPAIGPAGTVHASLADWARYVALHLEGDRVARGKKVADEPMLLKPETIERMHTAAAGEGTPYAMGWIVLEREWGGGRVLMHNGSNTMWYCVVWMAPEKDCAVLAATNQGGEKAAQACDEMASTLLMAHLGAKK